MDFSLTLEQGAGEGGGGGGVHYEIRLFVAVKVSCSVVVIFETIKIGSLGVFKYCRIQLMLQLGSFRGLMRIFRRAYQIFSRKCPHPPLENS